MLDDRKPTIALDVDDVVCRCIHGMAGLAKEHFGLTLTEEDITTWDFHKSVTVDDQEEFKKKIYDEMSKLGWCLSLEPFEGAVEGVGMLQQIANVFFVTAPFGSPYWQHERETWLRKHFSIPRSHIIQGSSKFLVRTDFFVDDKEQNVRDWSAFRPGEGVALLWDRPHNRTAPGLNRVHSWHEVFKIVLGFV